MTGSCFKWIVMLLVVVAAGASGGSADEPAFIPAKPPSAEKALPGQNGLGRFKVKPADKSNPQDRVAPPRPEEIDALLKFTQQHFPDVYANLVRARQEDTRAFRQMVRRLSQPMSHLMEIAKENPAEGERLIAIQKVEMRIREHKRRYQSAGSDGERATLLMEMRQLVERKFELRQAKLKQDTDDLRRKLAEQTQLLADQAGRRQQIIEEDLARLLEPAQKGRGPHAKPGGPSSEPAAFVPDSAKR